MSDNKSRGLGKGLSALLGDDDEDFSGESVSFISTVDLLPSPFQPRKQFATDSLEDLVNSITEKGVLQPLLVRKKTDENYEIIAGERRWRAAKQAGLNEVPVIIKDFADKEALEVALIENILRENLNPLEEAEGYKRLMDEFNNTQEALAQTIGKSRSYIANALRLLTLPDNVKQMLSAGQLSVGHARSLITAENPEALAIEIVNSGLNVREAEKLSKSGKKSTQNSVNKTKISKKSTDITALEKDLSAKLNLPVSIKLQGNKGAVTISFKGLEALDDLVDKLAKV